MDEHRLRASRLTLSPARGVGMRPFGKLNFWIFIYVCSIILTKNFAVDFASSIHFTQLPDDTISAFVDGDADGSRSNRTWFQHVGRRVASTFGVQEKTWSEEGNDGAASKARNHPDHVKAAKEDHHLLDRRQEYFHYFLFCWCLLLSSIYSLIGSFQFIHFLLTLKKWDPFHCRLS